MIVTISTINIINFNYYNKENNYNYSNNYYYDNSNN